VERRSQGKGGSAENKCGQKQTSDLGELPWKIQDTKKTIDGSTSEKGKKEEEKLQRTGRKSKKGKKADSWGQGPTRPKKPGARHAPDIKKVKERDSP